MLGEISGSTSFGFVKERTAGKLWPAADNAVVPRPMASQFPEAGEWGDQKPRGRHIWVHGHLVTGTLLLEAMHLFLIASCYY